ncbi:MAG TPA: LON peptidase substrate-binding domain-containing protein [Marmoricola sp.]|nr:LON peptidase substrate-binding domain-containing protein [Nocardioidaceae bacterium]MCB8993656.1 LON peptidase substrate-binding domain-containing protein [Nocardioidaceae bacterium]MCO5324500.1 LON peptidase substrate-binding domain-containing protein [Nocardioidaceae bacterium]HRV68154.1 LON peptidase substrate-binding domain-containing protein [Marmoricola sp.]
MQQQIPLFPLNAVVFPGEVVQLFIFEQRYRSMINSLIRMPDPEQRVFGIVAIREGYEVGDHGRQSLFTTGTMARLSQTHANPDGTFNIEAQALSRIRVLEPDASGAFLTAKTEPIHDDIGHGAGEKAREVRDIYARYLGQLGGHASNLRSDQDLPHDPVLLSYAVADSCPLTLPQRQSLLEAPDTGSRLELLVDYIYAELQAIRVLPSLPASEIARTRWSPN